MLRRRSGAPFGEAGRSQGWSRAVGSARTLPRAERRSAPLWGAKEKPLLRGADNRNQDRARAKTSREDDGACAGCLTIGSGRCGSEARFFPPRLRGGCRAIARRVGCFTHETPPRLTSFADPPLKGREKTECASRTPLPRVDRDGRERAMRDRFGEGRLLARFEHRVRQLRHHALQAFAGPGAQSRLDDLPGGGNAPAAARGTSHRRSTRRHRPQAAGGAGSRPAAMPRAQSCPARCRRRAPC